MGYDVFISYSHGEDDLLCERVQEGLSKFAKPWYRRHALKVFRDKTALSANPGLWSSITEAIDDSRYFLFLASPDAAASVWCGREVEHWRSLHGGENLLVLMTDGEILWDEGTNDFNWATTTALGPVFAGCFREEPFFIDMRWARSEEQFDLTDGRFRNQIADLAAPIHGMAKDELASEDVRQHRRAIRQATAAGIALVFLTLAAIVTSFFAVNNAGAARRNADRARTEQQRAEEQRRKATEQRRIAEENEQAAIEANKKTIEANKKERASRDLADQRRRQAEEARRLTDIANKNLGEANTNLTVRGRLLRKSTLLAQARLAARRSEQLMSSGDQTYQLGVLMAAEAVRHACASSAIDPESASTEDVTYPNTGCLQPGLDLDGSVANRALLALSNAGGKFVTGRLAGSVSPHLVAWSQDGRRFATFASAQASRPEVVQVWNADGSLVATATSAAGLTSDSALSGDGNVLALTSSSTGSGSVSAWSVASQRALSASLAGRRPALSADGSSMAWLARNRAKSVKITYRGAGPRVVALPLVPAGVAISPDGSVVAVLAHRNGDDFSLIPIDAVTGKVGAARDIGNFATPNQSAWINPPRISPGETADPPTLWFDAGGSTVWAYNNERHVGAQITRTASAPSARVAKVRTIPVSLGGGLLSGLVTSTPDGRTAVLYNAGSKVPTYQVSTESAGWSTPGLVPLELCSSEDCNLSISPNGAELAVSSLSALQIIDVRSPAGTSSGTIANLGAFPRGSSVVVGPTGKTALSWSARSLAMVDTGSRSVRRIPVPLGPGESVTAVGFDPRGARAVVTIDAGSGCPCRAVILDAGTGGVIRNLRLASTPLDRIANERPVGVTVTDAGDVVAVTFDNNPSASGSHRAGVATFSATTGQALQVFENERLGIGTQSVSVPAFRPGTDIVALVATRGVSREVGGVAFDARTGSIVQTLAMKAGVVTVDSSDHGNDGYALRFSPNGRLLAWNTGGSVVIWELASVGPRVEADVVLTSSSFFDPTAVAISDNGEVATVGLNYYSDVSGHNTNVVLTGDELGRFLQPLGISRKVAPSVSQVDGQISVAMPASGEIAAIAIDLNGARFFTDTWGAPSATLLSQLCASSSRVLTEGEWQTYFPNESYAPACPPPPTTAPWDIDASPTATLFSARSTPACPVFDRTQLRGMPPERHACRRRYIGIVSNSFAVVTRPTYSQANSRQASSVHTAANASVT